MDRGIFITWEMWRDKKTTLNEKAMLIEIGNLSMLEYGCIAHNSHFAETLGIKKEAVSRLISSLELKGYIVSKIKAGSRNFSRTITINKMLFDHKQNVIEPLTNCYETKENKSYNNTNITDEFISDLKSKAKYKTKVTKTKELKLLLKDLLERHNIEEIKKRYIKHQEENKNYAARITAFLEDYETVYCVSTQSNDGWKY